MIKRDILLWTTILVPPIVWFTNLLVNFAVAPLACNGPGMSALHTASFLSLLIGAASTLLAVSLWRKLGTEATPATGAPASRVRAMAAAGVVMGAGFVLAIIAQAVPQFILTGCE
jgi:hypothetical protein